MEPGMKFLHKGRCQRHIGVGEFGQQQDKLFRFLFRRGLHALRPGDGRVALLAPTRDAIAMRRMFSSSASCNMIGKAHNSPSIKGVTVW